MKHVWAVVKKEFYRFFRDKRMIVTVLLPGLLIYVLYSIMGTVFADKGKIDENFKPSAYVINMPAEISETLGSVLNLSTETMTEDEAKDKVAAGEMEIAVVFPENLFGQTGADVRIYYNSAKTKSAAAYSIVCAMLEPFKQPVFNINAGGSGDLADDKDTAANILSMLVPMLMFAQIGRAHV